MSEQSDTSAARLARILRRAAPDVSEPAKSQETFEAPQFDLEDRAALRRVPGLSTELEDISEVEYRQLRIERVVLIGVWGGSAADLPKAENSLRELAALADTAGAQVLDGVLQRRSKPDPATYLGKGKAQEVREIVAELGADTVIADSELAPSQRRALEDVLRVKVIDRTALILDIFAQHAKSREGKAQVELAQLEYLLPRLRGWGDSMSRQAGGQAAGGMGIGARGPGETKIELDRRRINTKIAKLKREIAAMKITRDTKRATRQNTQVPAVAIAGYTNAGKSSLLNRLTSAGVLVENALFATLDPTVRQCQTPDGRAFTVADTVGFVRSLPHQLVEAFRSTLEEIQAADLIIHVVDASDPDPAGQIAAVRQVIAEVEASGVQEILVLNKIDLVDQSTEIELRAKFPSALMISTRTGIGIDGLLDRVQQELPAPDQHFVGRLPYTRGDLVSRIHLRGRVNSLSYEEDGTLIDAWVKADLLPELEAARVT